MVKKTTQGRVLTAMHRGATIMVVFERDSKNELTRRYRLSPGGKLVPEQLFEHLLASGLIQSNEDGLPGLGVPQTYSIRRNLSA